MVERAGAEHGGVDLVHADDQVVVAVKPSGQLAVPGRGADRQACLYVAVRAAFPDALVVHRLDMATSGLMLFARGLEAQRTLNRAFADRRVGKQYVAVVAGVVASDAGEIDLPLLADWPNRPMQKVDPAQGKPSQTRYRVLSRDLLASRTRVHLEPVTGRAHQLRVHLLAIGHPILGDMLYAPPAARAAAGRLQLHAAALQFSHPRSGVTVSFQAAAPF